MTAATQDREALAAKQAAAVAALVANGPAPAGLDAGDLQACAASLFRKRRAGVAETWPMLAADLGSEFAPRFASFAAVVPLPAAGGPFADGRAFAAWLAFNGQLSDIGRAAALHADVRWRRTAAGLARRRWPCVRVAWLPDRRRLAIAWAWNG